MLAFCVALALVTSPACAHPPVDCVATLRVKPAPESGGGDASPAAANPGAPGGEVTIDVTHDALAFALNDTSRNIPDGPMLELLAGPDAELQRLLDAARERFETLCELLVDGERVPLHVTTMPAVADVRAWQRRHSHYPLPIRMELSARAVLPAGATKCSIRLPETLGDAVLVVERPGFEILPLPLAPGERSSDYVLLPHAPAQAHPREASVLWRFIVLGFGHIVPHGPDHVLFVVGLLLLVPRFRPLLVQISAFTLAHTVTLTLTVLGVIGAPQRIIEPAIALSIAFVGVENLLTTRVTWRRALVAFAFGLLHGMGVASAFAEGGFPPGQLVASLGAFTVGVEAGHVGVLLAAFALIGAWRRHPWYRTRIAIPASLVIAAIGVVWCVQRALV